MAAACVVVWGLYLLRRWEQRPTLAVVPLSLALLPRGQWPPWRTWLAAGGGAAVPLVGLLWHDWVAYGGLLRTGYSLTNEQTAFSWGYLQQHFVPYLRGLQAEGTGPLFPLGVAGVVALCAAPRTRRQGAVLAAAWVLQQAVRTWGRPALSEAEESGATQARAAGWLATRVPAGSLLVAWEPLQDNLDLLGRWQLVDSRALRGTASVQRPGPTAPSPTCARGPGAPPRSTGSPRAGAGPFGRQDARPAAARDSTRLLLVEWQLQ